MLVDAKDEGLESGKVTRVDSMVTETPIHAPSDSTLLWDSMRVLVRLLEGTDELRGTTPLVWHNHSRVSKKRTQRIRYTRG